jgi:hypothetical protein
VGIEPTTFGILAHSIYIYLVGEFLYNMKIMNHRNGSSHFKFESGMRMLFLFFKLIYVKKDFIMNETLKDINSQARREGGWRQRGTSSRAPSSKGAPNACNDSTYNFMIQDSCTENINPSCASGG